MVYENFAEDKCWKGLCFHIIPVLISIHRSPSITYIHYMASTVNNLYIWSEYNTNFSF